MIGRGRGRGRGRIRIARIGILQAAAIDSSTDVRYTKYDAIKVRLPVSISVPTF